MSDDRRRIPAKMKRRQNADRLSALKISDLYEKRLIRARTLMLGRALKLAKVNPIESWGEVIPNAVSEPYLPKLLRPMMGQVGKIGGKAILDQFAAKPKADKELWEMMFEQWRDEHVGEEIVSIQETMREWLQGEVMGVVDESAHWGVDKATKMLYERVQKDWVEGAEWMCRRIMRTETMNSLAYSAYECTMSLGIDVEKVWSTSGMRNVRDTHKVMEGVRVGMNKVFEVPNVSGGVDLMRFPHDGTMGASAGNIINCACVAMYLPKL